MVCLLDKAVHATLLQSQFVEEEFLVLVGVELGNVFLRLGGDDHGLSTLLAGYLLYLATVLVARLGTLLIDVADIEHGLCRQEKQIVGSLYLVFGLEDHRAGVLTLLQHLFVGLQHAHHRLGVFVARSGHLLLFGQLSFDSLQVLQLQLSINHLFVLYGIDGSAALAHHVGVVKATDDVDDGVALTDVSEKLVAQTLALGRTLDEACYIDNVAGGGNNASWVHDLGQFVEPLVGHGDDAEVRLNRTERIVGCLCFRARQAVEEG